MADTGIGIPPDKYEIIFDRFRQAEDLYLARQYRGTGLGLSIAKGLVKLMNRKIWLESELDKGTTFYFSLPFNNSKLGEDKSIEKVYSESTSLINKTILIVEDNAPNMEFLKEVLSDTGLKILCAYNGEEALNIFNKNSDIDLVLMDIRLPGSNELILSRIMRKSKPEMVIIAQTAYAAPSDIKNCIEAGCNDYLSKPINNEKLRIVVGQYLI